MLTLRKLNKSEALIENCKKISVTELIKLGYRLSGRQIPLGSKPFKFGIMEVVHDDKKVTDIVTFCYLYSTVQQTGIILPYGLDYYIYHPLVD